MLKFGIRNLRFRLLFSVFSAAGGALLPSPAGEGSLWAAGAAPANRATQALKRAAAEPTPVGGGHTVSRSAAHICDCAAKVAG